MEISVQKANGELYSNIKAPRMKKVEFANTKDKMRYVVNFLSSKATAKTTTDSTSHLKGAKFTFLKENGHDFDRVDYTIPGTKEEIDNLLDIVFN